MIRSGAIAIGLFCLLHSLAPLGAQESPTQGLLEAGIKSQTTGQHRLAVQTLTRALNAESLSGDQIAKALYYRGLAYKEISRPEQAIADLTGALFLSGLSDKERATAEQVRALAFRDGGTATVAVAGRAADAPAEGTQVARAEAPSFATRVETAQPAAPAPRPAPPVFSTSVEREEPKPQQKVAAAPPTSFSTHVDVAPKATAPPALRTTIAPAEPQPRKAPAPAQPPSWSTSVGGAAPPAPEAESGGSRLGRFFGNIAENITGSGSDTPAKSPDAPATQWVQTTRVDPVTRQQTAAAPPQAARPAAAPAAPNPAPATGGGGYRIQVAALPSEQEAQATWQRLSGRHKDLLKGRQPIIQRTDLGNLGIFYRVQLGPFNDQTESQRLCNDFKHSGLDCFVTAQ